MNKNEVENVLFDMGIPAGIKGFEYIIDALFYIDKHPENIKATKDLYPYIAKVHNTKPSIAERGIRHALSIARSERGNYENAKKYIGFYDGSNFNSLMMLYKKIKQEECEEPEKTNSLEEPLIKNLTVSEFRKIVRQEIKIALNEKNARSEENNGNEQN